MFSETTLPTEYIIRVGDFDNQVKDKEEQEFDVQEIILHEGHKISTYYYYNKRSHHS